MGKNYSSLLKKKLSELLLKLCLSIFIISFAYNEVLAQSTNTLIPISDAYVRNGTYASINYGNDTSLITKSAKINYTRLSYLKFSLSSLSNISSAKLRIYGRNTDNTSSISISSYGIDNDTWTENNITFNNAPTTTSIALSSVNVNNQAKYYEFDVSNYVETQANGDKVVSFLIKDPGNTNSNLQFNSKENSKNFPQLVVISSPPVLTLPPVADAFIRNGSYGGINYGSDTALVVKSSTSSGYSRSSYLKFSLSSATAIGSAKLRIYGRNTDNTSTIAVSSYPLDNDTWTESGITNSNAPTTTSTALSTASVTNQAKYIEFDVTNYVKTQFSGDKTVSFIVKDPANKNSNLQFNSKENSKNHPQLVISSASVSQPPVSSSPSNAFLFVENPDKFPANDHFVFSKIQIPWTRDSIYTVNHDSLRIRIHNKGINSLIINNLVLSSTSRWKIENIKGVKYAPGSGLPLTISSGTYADLMVKFIAVDQATRVKVVHDTLTIVSNDDKFPSKNIFLSGIWQKKGEGSNEPYAQEIINAFGFKTSTGFSHTDPDKGDSTKLKGNEIKPSYFVRADTTIPVSVIQMSAYHGCCNTSPEKIIWFNKGSSTFNTLFTHVLVDGQTVMPRKSKPSTSAQATFNPTTTFGFKVGYKDYTDAHKNPSGKIGIRVWKALDSKGNIIPNSYIISNDYLGTQYTNYDYNDNMYFVSNVRAEKGAAFYSELKASPSALDFGEKVLQSSNSLQLSLSNLGKTYADGSADPSITISSIAIAGENKSEFSASMPTKLILNPQEKIAFNVKFNPASEGLKIADLLIYYNNSQLPLRVPLYGIAKASGTTVTAHYRINSGSATAITINGKTWSADNQYAFDNLEPYTNSRLIQIKGTDNDLLYLKEQSSNGDKKPFRYEFPVTNGNYVVRLHFAELYWGTPGSGVTGGAGSRVMNVSLENQLRITNLDVFQEVGGATALVKNIPVTVADGKLNINFSANVNRPMVIAVEVYSFRSAVAKPVVSLNENNSIGINNLTKVRVYPNPVQKTLNIQFPGTYQGNVNLQIIDVTGKIYQIGKIRLQQRGLSMGVNISNLLKPGFYYLRILSDTKPAEVIKFIVM